MTPLIILVLGLAGFWLISVKLGADRAGAITARYPPEGQMVGGLHVIIRGAGPDIVLIHGASGSARDFTFQLVEDLASRYRVFAVDRPGMGHSPHLEPRYTRAFSTEAEPIRDQALAIRDAVAELGAQDPIVVGHSFGGAVALAWAVSALDEPDAVNPSALVLLGAVGMEWPGGISTIYQINGTRLGGLIAVPPIAAFVPDSYLQNAAESVFAPNQMPTGYDSHIGAALAVRPQALRANARHIRTLKPQIITQQIRYPELSLPIEWLHGRADTIVPADVHAIPFGQIVPAANIELLDGVGHMPHHVRPLETLAAIDRAAARADAGR